MIILSLLIVLSLCRDLVGADRSSAAGVGQWSQEATTEFTQLVDTEQKMLAYVINHGDISR